jgi:hypothetical protein
MRNCKRLKRKIILTLLLTVCACMAATSSRVAEVLVEAELVGIRGWRNDGSGRFESVTGGPTEWGPEKNIRWKTPLPHRSNASPILVAGRLYVCAEPDELVCVAADTGRVLWRQATSYLDLSTSQQLEPAKALTTTRSYRSAREFC